jgi:hypothetical protein
MQGRRKKEEEDVNLLIVCANSSRKMLLLWKWRTQKSEFISNYNFTKHLRCANGWIILLENLATKNSESIVTYMKVDIPQLGEIRHHKSSAHLYRTGKDAKQSQHI